MTQCPNCETELVGRYCHGCGQEAGPLVPPLVKWVKEAADELLGVDGRLPRTVRLLLTRPGVLTRDWAAGRRSRHIAPIRLFLGSAVVFFFAWQFSAARQGTYFADLFNGFLHGWYAGEDLPPPENAEEISRVLADRIVSGLRILLLVVSVPLLAVLNHGGWKDRSGAMVIQLTFSLHLHAVGLAVLALWLAIGHFVPGLLGPNVMLLPLCAMIAYLILAMRGAFSLSPREAVARGVGLAIAHWFLATALAAAYALVPGWPG